MNILNDLMANKDVLVKLLGDYENNLVGFSYSMTFDEVNVLTNDYLKAEVGGVPHNSFLVGISFDPKKFTETPEYDREAVLLRVLGPTPLPQDTEMLKSRIEHSQRKTDEEIFPVDAFDGMDKVTHNELQYGGLKCRVLGTFYVDDGRLRMGSDLENYMASSKLRIFKPKGDALKQIVNHVNPEVVAKAEEEARKAGFEGLPTPIEIGTVRYTSTDRLHRGPGEEKVPVHIQPSDFLARRTAVLGMTRTGKSNTVKTTVASVAKAARNDGVRVGQIIFDINGEYANANHQDDGSSIAEVFGDDCVRYRAVYTEGFEDLRANFYTNCAEGMNLLARLTQDDPYRNQTDLREFLDSGLEEPDQGDTSNHRRWNVRKAIFQCILRQAGFKPPEDFKIRFPVNQRVLDRVNEESVAPNPYRKGWVELPLDDAITWFLAARRTNYEIQAEEKEENKKPVGLPSSTKGKSWLDSTTEAYLNVLARENATKTNIRGYRAITPFADYHSPRRQSDVVDEIIRHIKRGKIVILDLSAGPVEIRTVLSERIARQIFEDAFRRMNQGETPQNTVLYVEEAHNLIGKKDDLQQTWPRIAKEGAKANIAFVYSTQEPSSIHPNILANTENWFVTHLNNDDELKALGKFYDFEDFSKSLKKAQDVGFARIKTLSSPFVVPTQIGRFTPEALKKELDEIAKKEPSEHGSE